MSNPNIKEELEAKREYILNNLTKDQEDTLRNIHAESYSGTDDDMPEAFDKWLEDLTIMDLEECLEIEII